MQGAVAPVGSLQVEVMRKDVWIPEHLRNWSPKSSLGRYCLEVARALPDKAMAIELLERISRTLIIESCLSLKILYKTGWVEDRGEVGWKVVTTAGANYLVDALQGLTEPENLKYHGIGTGSTAEAAGDTALVTELTTEYNPNSTRATGSLTEGASANIFRSIATNTLDGTPGAALREHGIFSAASAGTLLDRTVFAAITLNSGDGLQSTYDFTVNAGG